MGWVLIFLNILHDMTITSEFQYNNSTKENCRWDGGIESFPTYPYYRLFSPIQTNHNYTVKINEN